MKKVHVSLIILAVVTFCSNTVFGTALFLGLDEEKYDVPVIMYHLITNDAKYHGKFGISAEALESDLLYLRDNGYKTIVVKDLIDFVEYGEPLPDKPVMLTFDDGAGSDFHYLFPLLKKYDMKAVLSVVTKLADDYSSDSHTGKKPHLTWAQIKEMSDSGYVEIQNHSYNLHGNTGSGKLKGEPEQSYKIRLKKDLELAQKSITEKIGKTPAAFAYPLGIISEASHTVVKELGIKCTFSCEEGINKIYAGKPDALFKLKRNNRRSGYGVKAILNKIEQMYTGGK